MTNQKLDQYTADWRAVVAAGDCVFGLGEYIQKRKEQAKRDWRARFPDPRTCYLPVGAKVIVRSHREGLITRTMLGVIAGYDLGRTKYRVNAIFHGKKYEDSYWLFPSEVSTAPEELV